jgi:hypothetical protein
MPIREQEPEPVKGLGLLRGVSCLGIRLLDWSVSSASLFVPLSVPVAGFPQEEHS